MKKHKKEDKRQMNKIFFLISKWSTICLGLINLLNAQRLLCTNKRVKSLKIRLFSFSQETFQKVTSKKKQSKGMNIKKELNKTVLLF